MVPTDVDWGDRDSGASAAAAGRCPYPRPIGRPGRGVRAEIAGCQCAIATVLLRAIADGASVSDRGLCHRGRSRKVTA